MLPLLLGALGALGSGAGASIAGGALASGAGGALASGAGGGLMSMLGEAGGGIMSILGGGEDEEGGMSGGNLLGMATSNMGGDYERSGMGTSMGGGGGGDPGVAGLQSQIAGGIGINNAAQQEGGRLLEEFEFTKHPAVQSLLDSIGAGGRY